MTEMKKNVLRTALAAFGTVMMLGTGMIAYAEGNPTISLEAGQPDENGVVTLLVSAENTDLLTYELGIRYNTKALEPFMTDGGTGFEGFSEQGLADGMSYIGTRLDAEKGCFLFTGFASPGSKSELYDGKKFCITDKTLLYTFRFKTLSDEDYGFEIASVYDGGVYDDLFPDGAVVYGGKTKPSVVDVIIRDAKSEKTAKTAEILYSQTNPKNFTKEDRLKKTVYLVKNDFAAAADGALKAIDPDNHAVVPYEKNGTRFYPLRFVCENLGRKVVWDEQTATATVSDAGGNTVGFDVAGKTAKCGDAVLEGAVELKEDRTMVSESLLTALGFKVYDGKSFVIVYDSPVVWDPARDAEKDALSAMQYVLMPFFRAFI